MARFSLWAIVILGIFVAPNISSQANDGLSEANKKILLMFEGCKNGTLPPSEEKTFDDGSFFKLYHFSFISQGGNTYRMYLSSWHIAGDPATAWVYGVKVGPNNFQLKSTKSGECVVIGSVSEKLPVNVHDYVVRGGRIDLSSTFNCQYTIQWNASGSIEFSWKPPETGLSWLLGGSKTCSQGGTLSSKEIISHSGKIIY